MLALQVPISKHLYNYFLAVFSFHVHYPESELCRSVTYCL